jgi:hypothetical protein
LEEQGLVEPFLELRVLVQIEIIIVDVIDDIGVGIIDHGIDVGGVGIGGGDIHTVVGIMPQYTGEVAQFSLLLLYL